MMMLRRSGMMLFNFGEEEEEEEEEEDKEGQDGVGAEPVSSINTKSVGSRKDLPSARSGLRRESTDADQRPSGLRGLIAA